MALNSDHLSITRDGQPRELFMSFGLLHELLAVVGDIVEISAIAVNAPLRDAVLTSVLAERNEKGVIQGELNLFVMEIPRSDIQVILSWVAGHVLDFFLTAIEESLKTHNAQTARLTSSMVSGNGSTT